MANWKFDSNAEGWTNSYGMGWSGFDGSPAPGCMLRNTPGTPFDYVEATLTGLSIPVQAGDNISFRARVKGEWSGGFVSGVAFVGSNAINGFVGSAFKTAAEIDLSSGDSGWITVTGTITNTDTIDTLTVRIGDPLGDDTLTFAAFDNLFVAEVETNAARLYWGHNSLQFSKEITGFYGVWQDGLAPSNVTSTLQTIALGTHVSNNPHVIKGTYEGGTFVFGDITYNLPNCADETASYVVSYGATYAAAYYRSVFCNVKALEWI